MIVILFLLAGVASAVDPMVCSLHGQGHVLMTDGSTRYTLTGAGLANIYSTTGLDVQCDFNQTASAQSTLSSCRFLISSTTSPCSVDIVHGNQPGQVTVWGQTVSVTALEEFVSANVDSALGLACHAIDDDTITIEITQRDAERFILIESSLSSLTITTSNVTSCSGAFGTCQGPQIAPRAETIAVMPFRAIQPQVRCGSSTVSPIASPYPSISPYADTNGMEPIAAFASPEIRNQVIASCSSNDQARMVADSLFSGFVEACADDIALGASPVVAKANMDSFVKVIENRQKVEMAAEALQRNPASIICAACMDVQWDNPVNTSSVLDAAKVLNSPLSSQRAKSHSMYKKPNPFAPHNLYEKRPSVASTLSEVGLPEIEFPKSAPADLPMTVRPVTTEPTTAPMTMSRPAATDAPTTEPQSYMPQSVTTETNPPQTQMPLPSSSNPLSNDDSMPTRKPLYEHVFKPSDDIAMPSSSSTPSPSFGFPASPVGYEMPTTTPSSAVNAQPSTSAPMTAPMTSVPTTAPMGNMSNAMNPTPAPTTGFNVAAASQQPMSPTTVPTISTSGSGSIPQNPVNANTPLPSSSPITTPSPSGNESMPNSKNPMPGSLSTTAPTSSPTGNQTMGQMISTPSPSINVTSFTPVPPPSPTPSPSATTVAVTPAAVTPVPPPSPTPAPTSSMVAAVSSPSTPMPSASSTPAPSSGTPTGNNTSPSSPTTVPTPVPTGQQALGANVTTVPSMAPGIPTTAPLGANGTTAPTMVPGVPTTAAPLTPTTNLTPDPRPNNSTGSGPATTIPSSTPGSSWPSSSTPNASSPTVVPIGTPTTAPTSTVAMPWTSTAPTTSPTNNMTSPWIPSHSPMGNSSATPVPTSNGTSALGASIVPPPSVGSTRPPITALPIAMPFIVPSTAPQTVELPYQPFSPPVMPATTAPLTGRGSVYGCQCNMSNSDLKDSLEKVQYALDSFLMDALTKSVLNGEDHNLLTVIACGLGGPNNDNIRALSISEIEASNLCRQCQYGSNSNLSPNNDRLPPIVNPTSSSSMYANARRTRNIGPVSGMNSGFNKGNAGATLITNGLPTSITNPSTSINGAYPNREGSGMIPVFGSSRVRSQYAFTA